MRIKGMLVDELVTAPGSWLSIPKPNGVVLSSRIRLARNISGVAFPGWAGEEERARVCNELQRVLAGLSSLSGPQFLDMGLVDTLDKDVLRERHLISYEMAERGRGSVVAVSDNAGIAIMINEEDHLRLQAIAPGMNIKKTWNVINAVDSELEAQVNYAFSDRLGYFTSCPSNVGTGLRASVMMHLAGLRMLNEVELVINGLEKLGLTVRGLLGEGTEAHGNMFQVSNQQTLGDSETQIIDSLSIIVTEVVQHELNARTRIREKRATHLADAIARARAILLNCRTISSQEAVDLLSTLRLGVELEMIGNLKVGRINEIMILTQAGHLQKIAGRLLSPDERDERRACLVRDKIQGASLVV